MRRTTRLLVLPLPLVLAAGVVSVAVSSPSVAATLPAQFTDSSVVSVASPTALAFMPDGRMLVSTQPGRLRVVSGGTLLATAALDISARVCSNSERGLLGVATDPDAASKAIYLFYTAKGTDTSCPTSSGANPTGAPRNRVSKFVLRDDNTVDPASETILLDGIYSSAGNHNAGDLAVGKDGHLYVTTGDGGCDYKGDSGCAGSNDAARDRNVLNGKILRITRTGGIPADNPFTGTGTARCQTAPAAAGTTCQETFATGLRNPFRFAFDPDAAGTSFRINDVGQNVWEEIDQGVKGADYGWNSREGHCANTGSESNCGAATPAGLTDPVHDYGHSTGCASITGAAYVPDGIWPAAYDGSYLFADYVCGKIFALSSAGVRTDFATGLGGSSAVHLAFGPHGTGGGKALYYTTYAGGGEVRRIAYTGAVNRAPSAALTASPSSGAAPLTATLSGSGSTDPDGDALTYLWSFGDGTADATTTTPTTTHTYAAGSWTASLRVRDPAGLVSAPATVAVSSGNTAPTVTITSPSADELFSVGGAYVLRGTATDAQDGTLPDSALSWTVLRHHDTHTHPYLGPTTGNGVALTGPGPEDLAAAANSYLEIRLTATDSNGLSTTVTRSFQPRKVAVTLATSPAGRTVTVNGTSVTGPTTVTSWAGFQLQVAATAQSDAAGRPYGFDRWSDGGAAAHTVTTPTTATTLTAVYSLRGLLGHYHDDLGFTGSTVVRLDPTVGFNWATEAPAPGIGADTFSVRWSGQVSPRYSETYTFSTSSDDGVRLWVDGTLLVDQWNDHGTRVHSGTIALTAGVRYAVTMEFYDNTRHAVAQLRWSSATQSAEIVPTERLYPAWAVNFQPAGRPVPAGYIADTGAIFGRSAGQAHGWNADNSAQTRDRDAASSPDQRYDTLTHLQKPGNPNASWELAVPPGTYRVHAVSGDPGHVDSVFRINAESTQVVAGTPTSTTRWVEGTADVAVIDGRLTLTNGSGASNNKLNFVVVTLL
jgi:glucose/arabinose dehydrogenase